VAWPGNRRCSTGFKRIYHPAPGRCVCMPATCPPARTPPYHAPRRRRTTGKLAGSQAAANSGRRADRLPFSAPGWRTLYATLLHRRHRYTTYYPTTPTISGKTYTATDTHILSPCSSSPCAFNTYTYYPTSYHSSPPATRRTVTPHTHTRTPLAMLRVSCSGHSGRPCVWCGTDIRLHSRMFFIPRSFGYMTPALPHPYPTLFHPAHTYGDRAGACALPWLRHPPSARYLPLPHSLHHHRFLLLNACPPPGTTYLLHRASCTLQFPTFTAHYRLPCHGLYLY